MQLAIIVEFIISLMKGIILRMIGVVLQNHTDGMLELFRGSMKEEKTAAALRAQSMIKTIGVLFQILGWTIIALGIAALMMKLSNLQEINAFNKRFH